MPCTLPRYGELLRIIVTAIALTGIFTHIMAATTYMWCDCNPVGIDFRSPVVKIALTVVMPYKDQNKFEPIMKLVAEGGGILAYMCLFLAAVKRSVISCLLFITFAFLYLTGVTTHLFILFKMSKYGFTMSEMSTEIMAAVLTALFEYLAIICALMFLIQLWRWKKSSQQFELGTPHNEIPTTTTTVTTIRI